MANAAYKKRGGGRQKKKLVKKGPKFNSMGEVVGGRADGRQALLLVATACKLPRDCSPGPLAAHVVREEVLRSQVWPTEYCGTRCVTTSDSRQSSAERRKVGNFGIPRGPMSVLDRPFEALWGAVFCSRDLCKSPSAWLLSLAGHFLLCTCPRVEPGAAKQWPKTPQKGWDRTARPVKRARGGRGGCR